MRMNRFQRTGFSQTLKKPLAKSKNKIADIKRLRKSKSSLQQAAFFYCTISTSLRNFATILMCYGLLKKFKLFQKLIAVTSAPAALFGVLRYFIQLRTAKEIIN